MSPEHTHIVEHSPCNPLSLAQHPFCSFNFFFSLFISVACERWNIYTVPEGSYEHLSPTDSCSHASHSQFQDHALQWLPSAKYPVFCVRSPVTPLHFTWSTPTSSPHTRICAPEVMLDILCPQGLLLRCSISYPLRNKGWECLEHYLSHTEQADNSRSWQSAKGPRQRNLGQSTWNQTHISVMPARQHS